MKNLIKLLLSIAVLAAFTVAQADVTVATKATGSTFNLLSTGGKIVNSVTVVPAGTNTVLRFYDSSTTGITYTTSAYITEVPTAATTVTTFVGPTGVTNSFTNTSMTMVTTTNAAATNTLPTLRVYAAPSSTPVTFTEKTFLKNGLTISNDVACTIIVDYETN